MLETILNKIMGILSIFKKSTATETTHTDSDAPEASGEKTSGPETIDISDSDGIDKVAAILKNGGVAIIPTDTVYGLAAHPNCEEAVKRLYSIKGRTDDKPIALLASSCEAVEAYGFPLEGEAKTLAEKHWPGALTIVATNAAGKTEGFRVPAHLWTRKLIEACGGILRVTSANKSGEAATTNLEAAAKSIGRECDIMADGGSFEGGVASTVVKVSPGAPLQVLREGNIRISTDTPAQAPTETAKRQERRQIRMSGRFFVTLVAAQNKAVFGAIAGAECFLNELGHELRNVWRSIIETHPEAAFYDYTVMPNHFHAALRIFFCDDNKEDHIGHIIQEFTSRTEQIYQTLRAEKRVQDIGEKLWRDNDLTVSAGNENQMQSLRAYIRENPLSWTRDRYGVCTTHSLGNLDLLEGKKVAFVASSAFPATPLQPHKIKGAGASSHDGEPPPMISTFTSRQEREMLRRALAKNRRVIQVRPDGIPPENELNPLLAAACRAGRALIISPQPQGSSMNKKTAEWCNEYVLANAQESWAGDITPGGTLSNLLKTIK